jgi:hypothetical protein
MASEKFIISCLSHPGGCRLKKLSAISKNPEINYGKREITQKTDYPLRLPTPEF